MEEKKSIGFAIASMVLGIVAILFSCCTTLISIPCAIVGVILGGVAMDKIAKGTGRGKGMAIAGIVTGIVSLIPTIYVLVLGSAIGWEFWNGFF